MKSSVLLAATGAVLALAGPLEQRAIETDIVVEYFTVTVTGNPPAATPTQVAPANVPSNSKSKPFIHNEQPVVQQPPAPQPEPTTAQPEPSATLPVVVVVTVTPEAQPQPSSVETPAPAPTTPVVKQPAPVETTVAAPSGPAPGSFESETLYHHNIHRSNHSSPEMTWNDQIAGYAAITAKTCVFKHDMTEGDGNYGQNIALWGVSSGAEALGATGAIKMATTNMWYDGEFNSFLPSYYGQATPDMSNFEAWGHLSQLVWADSTTVGCAVQFCPRGTAYSNLDAWFSVCNYYPPGNVGGAYAQNINRPKGDASVVV